MGINAADDAAANIATMLKALVVSLAPLDFGGARPFYVVPTSLCAPATRLPSDTLGLAGEGIDVWLRADLERLGWWQGRGPAITFNDIELPRWGLLGFACTIAHEAAHALELLTTGFEFPEVARVETSDGQAVSMADCLAALKVMAVDTDAPKWIGHGPLFVRLALHLWYRLRFGKVSLPILPRDVVSGERYGLSPAERYYNTLSRADELADWARADRPLHVLARQPYPAAFAELWERDTGTTPHALGPP